MSSPPSEDPFRAGWQASGRRRRRRWRRLRRWRRWKREVDAEVEAEVKAEEEDNN
jgi:hypothetical protein